jgi:hypothetical protein
MFSNDLEIINPQTAKTISALTGDKMMADFARLVSGYTQNAPLDEQDLLVLCQQVGEIDAAYGEFLDVLVPATLIRLTETSRAA